MPETRTGRRVAVVGSGPAGLAAAQQLNHAGHTVVVFERDEATGGLLRFGVPGREAREVDDRPPREACSRRRASSSAAASTSACDLTVEELRAEFDAVVIATGSRVPRGVEIEGHDLAGVHAAMDYLYQRNRAVAREEGREAPRVAEEVICADRASTWS